MEKSRPLLLVLLLMAMSSTVQAQFDYTTNADGISITITEYLNSGLANPVTIPTTINGLPVTIIGDDAFGYCDLTSVTIPFGVTNIAEAAFEGCTRLTNAAIPASVTNIGFGAFDFSGLKTVTISNGVTSIGQAAFESCTSLRSVTISASITNIGAGAFEGCTILQAITVDAQNLFYSSVNGVLFDESQATLIQAPGGLNGSYTISNSVTSIGSAAFEDCSKLTNVTIPGNVTSIGADAFGGTGLTNVMIPGSVTNIGSGPFSGCKGLTAITVDAQNSFYSSVNGVLFDESQATLIQAPGSLAGSYAIPGSVTSIGADAFIDSSVTSVTIPSSVTNIGNLAFSLTGLTSVTIPGSVISIGTSAFAFCRSLTNANIGNGVTSIGADAFEGCSSLTNMTIPGSVTNITGYAFYDCTRLANVSFTGNPPSVGLYAFTSDDLATVYYLPGATGWSSPFAGLPAVLWNALIQTSKGSFGLQNNQFGFNITGTANIPIVVEACTNLANPVWTPLQSLTLTNGSFYFSEPAQANISGRFYGLGFP